MRDASISALDFPPDNCDNIQKDAITSANLLIINSKQSPVNRLHCF